MKNTETIKEQLKKILALVERGEDGERITAKLMLDKLLKKHNIQIEDIQDISEFDFEIPYKNKWERKLITQIYCKITDKSSVSYSQVKNKRMTWKISMTKLQAAEFFMLYNIYTKAYSQELENLNQAFIMKHKIYSQTAEGKESKLSLEDIKKIIRMKNSMNDVLIPRGQIEENLHE